ncbi:MAG TPA: carboxyltransferase domain-containing protein [Acidimicrobiales bacterium]
MRTSAGRIVPFGDRALLAETADVAAAHALAGVLDERRERGTAPAGIDEVVVGFASVLVVLDPRIGRADARACVEWVAEAAGPTRAAPPAPGRTPRTHVLPVVFDGADLAEVAASLGHPVDRVVELVVAAELDVAFVGFAPGFPYLTGLPPEFAALPRRTSPRTSVPAGSVAVAAGFASVYPRSTPGGWHLLGRTAESLFDPDVPPHSRVAPGDRVRFTASDRPLPHRPDDDRRPPLRADGPCLEVLEPGLATTVQDGGRRGCAHLGVPAAGAADPRSLALANLLVGNPADAAALECTASGPVVRMVGTGHLAVVGAGAGAGAVDVTVDGHPVADGTVLPVAGGQVVRVGRVRRGLRAYVAVAGGLATPVVLGSRSSDTLAGLGPGVLRAGDRLARGAPGRIRGHLAPPGSPEAGPTVLRVVAGPHGSPGDGLAATTWTVGAEVDRIGVRLDAADGPPLVGGGRRASTPMVTGAVQVPPDGRPIVLLPDHATVGGYPVVACVVTADLPVLGQLAPGDAVAFVEVDRATAAELRVEAQKAPAARVTGWFPTVAGT